ncbi:MAG: hypothetical protein QOG43_2169 [Actinomycetota bacterium]|jgi:hypothetical protein|nr:hypothetical protein [Actinomycetota bacterium]
MDDHGTDLEEMRAGLDTPPAEREIGIRGMASADDGMKWWRWYPYAGRWMPSEPPEGEVDEAYWFVSDAPPAFRGPRSTFVDDDSESPSPRYASESSAPS